MCIVATQLEKELKGKYPWEDKAFMSPLKGGAWLLKVEKIRNGGVQSRGGAEEKDLYVPSHALFLFLFFP